MDQEVRQFVDECAQAAALAKRSAASSRHPEDRAFWLALAAEWESLASDTCCLAVCGIPLYFNCRSGAESSSRNPTQRKREKSR